MRKHKFVRQILSCILVASMILSTCITAFATESENKPIVYVSIGDSMTNGYGIDGYDGESGIANYANATYGNQFAAWLAGYTGDIVNDQVIFTGTNGTVEHRQLAMSGMRAEDVHWVLELDYEDEALINKLWNYQYDGNSWQDISEKWYGELGFKAGDYRTWADVVDANYRYADGAAKILDIYNNNPDTNGKYFVSSYADGINLESIKNKIAANKYFPESDDDVAIMGSKYLQISTEFYQKSVKDADIISLALGNTNFGTYMLNEIMDVTMKNKLNQFSSRYDIENVFNLAGLDNETESAVRDLIAECDGIIEQMFGTLAGGNQDKMEALRNVIIYCITSYAVNYIGAVEAILKLNPDVDIIQIALMNAYADEGEEITDTTLGDIVDVLYTPVNAFIAAIPTVMKGANRDLYKDATFYYAEADSVDCLVNVFGADFYKDSDGNYVEYPGLLNGDEGYTGNVDSTVRDRFKENIVEGQTFALMNEMGVGVVRDLSVAEIMAYDMMTPTEKAVSAATNADRAKSIALYLAFENATIQAGKGTVTLNSLAALGDLSSAFGGIMTTLQADATAYGRENYLDEVAEVVVGIADNPLLTSDVLKTLYEAEDQDAAIVAFITEMVKNQAQANSSVQTIISNGIHESFDDILACLSDTGYHSYCSSVKTVYEGNLNTAITNYKPGLLYAIESTGNLCYLLGLPQTLSNAMVNNSTLSGILCMNARCLIGTGIGGHPSTTGHDAVYEAVRKSYSEKYTAQDETIANITAIIKEYYDEAYAYAYAEADKHGYVDKAEEAIDKAIEVINSLDFSNSQMTDEFKAQLAAELTAIVATLEEIKAVLAENKASDVTGLVDSILALQDDLYIHLAGAGAILAQAEYDVETLVVPVIDAYVSGLMNCIGKAAEEIRDTINSYIAEFQGKAEADFDELKDAAALQLAKISHKKYVKDSSYYVAIGGDTVRAANIGRDDSTYYELIGEELAIDVKAVNKDVLLPSQIVELVEANAAEIEKADFITYQTDASSFIYAVLMDALDWDNYIEPEKQELIKEILEHTQKVLAENWNDYTAVQLSKVVEKVKSAVVENLPSEIPFDEEVLSVIDMVVGTCVPYIMSQADKIEEEKDEVVSKLVSIDGKVHDYAEKLAYVAVSYAVETAKAIETIQAINPDAALYVVGMYNPVRGLEIVSGNTVISAEEIFDYVIDATNLYYAAYAAANKNFAFVDVSEAATDGFEDQIDVTALEIGELSTMIFSLGNKMYANADGHEYIAKQILAATKCNYSAPAKLDNEKHFVECTICGHVVEEDHTKSYEKLNSTQHTVTCSVCNESWTEDHTFSGRTCTECGYVKSSGGGSGSGSYIKEETPATSTFKFTDVRSDKWYYDVIKKVVEKGLMNGISETQFAPELEVTRGMFVTILYRAAGEPEVSAATNFADVTTDMYYAKAVAWANANGIVKGITETEFAPDNNITREQMATILYRYAKNKAAAEVNYTDKDAISDYAMEAVAWAKAAGIMQGNADGTFAPVRNASRAEAAAVFVRMFKL